MTSSKHDIPVKPRLRVLHVGPGCGQRGGMASVLRELSDMRARFAREAIEIAVFETRGFRRIGALIRFAVRDVPRFAWATRQTDIVHLHVSARGSLYRKAMLFAIAKLFRKRTVIHLHAGDFDRFAAGADRLTRRAIRWFVGGADAAVGVSSSCAGVLNDFRLEPDARVIGNSARDAQHASSRSPTMTATMSTPRPTIAFAGRLTRQKGVDLLIEALVLLKHAGRDVNLALAGDGDIAHWRTFAEARGVADRIHFAGWLDGDDKAAFYRNASVFCLPSRFESFGIVALEAMFFGVPVVAARIGGLADLVVDGTTGYLVEPDNPQALAHALETMLSMPRRRAEMGNAGGARAHRQYAIDAIARQYVECHRQIASRP